MERSFDAVVQFPKSESAFRSLMAWYTAVVAHGVAFMVECYLSVVRLYVVVEAFGIFCLFFSAHGGLVSGEVFSVDIGVSTPSASAAV